MFIGAPLVNSCVEQRCGSRGVQAKCELNVQRQDTVFGGKCAAVGVKVASSVVFTAVSRWEQLVTVDGAMWSYYGAVTPFSNVSLPEKVASSCQVMHTVKCLRFMGSEDSSCRRGSILSFIVVYGLMRSTHLESGKAGKHC